MAENKWREFKSSRYHLQDLGRPAVFLIPLKKLQQETDGIVIEDRLHRFLVAHFTAYTSSSVPSFGVWKDSDQKMIRDESRQYRVSFAGKDRIPLLIEELADIARITGEDCIYLEAGQYACLVYPK